MSEHEEIETVEVPKEALCHMAYELAMECDDHEVYFGNDRLREDFYDNMRPADVKEVEILDSDSILIHAKTYAREPVDYIPAGPGTPPINPPEVVFDEREIWYTIRFTMDGLGYAELHAELV